MQPIHLPPASEFGERLEYRIRQFAAGGGFDDYVTTGVYKIGSPDAKREHLQACGVVFIDADIADYVCSLLPNYKSLDANGKSKAAKEIKQWLWTQPQSYIDEQAAIVWRMLWVEFGRIDIHPTLIVSSGYGFHSYFWLAPGETRDIERLTRLQIRLIETVNASAGFDLADPELRDPGTRVLRVVPSVNSRGIVRPVQIVYRSDIRTPLAELEAKLKAAPAPATQPPTAGAAASTSEAKVKRSQGAHKVFEALRAHPGKAARGLARMFERCPFIRWAIENPSAIGIESWRAVAVNIAAVAGAHGFDAWDQFSQLDSARYNAREVAMQWEYAIKSSLEYGPITYEYLASLGEWPGPAKQKVKSPAMLAVVYADAPDISGMPDLRTDDRGNIKPTAGNCRKVLRAHPIFGSMRRNLMGDGIELGGEAITNEAFGMIAEVIEDEYRVAFPPTTIKAAVTEIATEKAYHPVEDYLNSLRWDGYDRVDWLLAMIGAPITPLTRCYVRVFLLGAAVRGLCHSPDGVKFDYVLTLVGAQNVGKSSFFAALASRAWFSDSDIDPRQKDALLAGANCWIRELPEIDTLFARYGGEQLYKGWITSQVDQVRPPWGLVFERRPRRSVCVATANREFLSDPTGSRRFMVLPATRSIDFAAIALQRDQVWAQAMVELRAGGKWWIDDPALQAAQTEANYSYSTGEPWANIIARWVRANGIEAVTCERVLIEAIGKEANTWSPNGSEARTVSAVLSTLGFQKRRVQRGAVRVTVYYTAAALESDVERAVSYV